MPFVTNGNADRTGPEAAWESALSGATPLITVAICTRNRAASLQKAVDSVLPQLSEDIELLIVDNASTDNTPEVAMHLAAANRQVTVCLEDEVGLSAARNKALSNDPLALHSIAGPRLDLGRAVPRVARRRPCSARARQNFF